MFRPLRMAPAPVRGSLQVGDGVARLAGIAVDVERVAVQLGGLVEPGSVQRTVDGLRFTVAGGTSPGSATVSVLHTGTPAQLFRNGIGVVLEGSWRGDVFVSDAMLVKHDETYRAPENRAGAAR